MQQLPVSQILFSSCYLDTLKYEKNSLTVFQMAPGPNKSEIWISHK